MPWPAAVPARSDRLASLFASLDSIFRAGLLGRDEFRQFAEMNVFEMGTQRGAQVVVAVKAPPVRGAPIRRSFYRFPCGIPLPLVYRSACCRKPARWSCRRRRNTERRRPLAKL